MIELSSFFLLSGIFDLRCWSGERYLQKELQRASQWCFEMFMCLSLGLVKCTWGSSLWIYIYISDVVGVKQCLWTTPLSVVTVVVGGRWGFSWFEQVGAPWVKYMLSFTGCTIHKPPQAQNSCVDDKAEYV